MSRKEADNFDQIIKLRKKVDKLDDIIAEYKKENQELRDEAENLWFMLDEFKESEQFSREHTDYLEDFVKQQVLKLKLMRKGKGEA